MSLVSSDPKHRIWRYAHAAREYYIHLSNGKYFLQWVDDPQNELKTVEYPLSDRWLFKNTTWKNLVSHGSYALVAR